MQNSYQRILKQSKRIEEEVAAIVADPSDECLVLKPSPDIWSVLEVIEHLNLVYDKYLDNLNVVISEAKPLPKGEQPKAKRTLLGRLSIYSQKPKKKRRRFKMKTFDFFTPSSERSTQNIIADFHSRKNTFHGLIELASGKELRSAKVPTALGEKVKFYILECFEFLLAHEERHLVQIKEIKEVVDKKRGTA